MSKVGIHAGREAIRAWVNKFLPINQRKFDLLRRDRIESSITKTMSRPSTRKALFLGGASATLIGAVAPVDRAIPKACARSIAALGAVSLASSLTLFERQLLWAMNTQSRQSKLAKTAMDESLTGVRKDLLREIDRRLKTVGQAGETQAQPIAQESAWRQRQIPSALSPLGESILDFAERNTLFVLPSDEVHECIEFLDYIGCEGARCIDVETSSVQRDIGQFNEIVISAKGISLKEISPILPAAWISKNARVRVLDNRDRALELMNRLNWSTGTRFSSLPTTDLDIAEFARVRTIS